MAVVLEFAEPNLNIEISNWSASIVPKITGIAIYLTILSLVKNSPLKFFIWLVISAGLGNLISHFYYPYRVVDFVNVEGSYEFLRIGVFNFADLIFDVGIIGILTTLIILTLKKVKVNRLTT